MKWSKSLASSRTTEESCVYKKVSGSAIAFLILYVDDILLIGNDVTFLNEVKESLKKSFSMKDLGEAAYILGIKIYRDRSRRLIGLCQEYISGQSFEEVQYGRFQERFIPTSHGKTLSKNQCPQTVAEREYMSECTICFSNWFYHVCHDMYKTRCVLCSKCYEQIPE